MKTKIAVKDNKVFFIHDDGLVTTLKAAGFEELAVKRLSHVDWEDGSWWADMGPVRGPKLGPFPTRGDALKAEVQWIESRLSELKPILEEKV